MPTGGDAGGGGGGGGEKERRKKVELLQEAIHGLLEEKRGKQRHQGEEGAMDHEEDLFLSSLLSKLDSLENDVDPDGAEPSSINPHPESGEEAGPGDVAKDLGKIKRQNMITHILLGTVMVMIAAWQFNEVSFLLAVQKKLTNPFKSVGDMVKSTLKIGKKPMAEAIEASPLPPVGAPDVARADLPMLAIGDGDS
ncbi:uncharacterized protein LOC119355546 [Triticum dicoccoides]|uniref:uncharacterized protein LOC119355546 n=1 Tax=Triticum dicoccoides TaxID=85692 RepID=UPI000E7D179B|nr:uncharacterized protein LOC119355546 [Triticum dicoccoides]